MWEKWRAVVTTVISLWIPLNMANCVTGNCSFSVRTAGRSLCQFHGSKSEVYEVREN